MPIARHVLAVAIAIALAIPAAAFELALPLDCDPGRTCFVQNYVDVAPGPDAKDYTCGSATYDTHTGVDIRVGSLAIAEQAGIEVRAAAPGTVLKIRDGIPDSLIESAEQRAAVMQIGLGNVVIIGHEDGYQTIYAHMRKGSVRVRVRSGDKVDRGTPLGVVGASGLTQFAHVHFEVRKGDALIDPFTGAAASGASATGECHLEAGAGHAGGLWSETVRAGFAYAGPRILSTGWAGGSVGPKEAERGGAFVPVAATNSPALVFFAHVMHLKKGDRIRLVLAGPEGFEVTSEGEPVDRDKATYVQLAGKRLKAAGWAAGQYQGRAEVVRGGAVVAASEGRLVLP
jgi:hypothetical protein